VRVRDHVLISTAGAALAAPSLGRGALSLWAGGVLIDADHYAWFCLRHRRLSLQAAVRFFNQADPPQHPATRALHAPAAVLSVVLIGLGWRRLRPVALGMGLHVALDAYHLARMARARSAALARDGYRCRACGAQAPPVTAHVWRQPRLLPSYRHRNLVSLCRRCHDAAHAHPGGAIRWNW
jgi:hypothetical protein